jgi:transposase
VNLVATAAFLAAIGDIARFRVHGGWSPTSAWTRRSASPANSPPAPGGSPSAGRRRRVGRWSRRRGASSTSPGPLRAYYQRIRARRGHGKAIVAAARKLAVLFWCLLHRGEDYAHQQPSLTAQKLRRLELNASAPVRKGKRSGVWVTHARMR